LAGGFGRPRRAGDRPDARAGRAEVSLREGAGVNRWLLVFARASYGVGGDPGYGVPSRAKAC
jgi:hypothetical protein